MKKVTLMIIVFVIAFTLGGYCSKDASSSVDGITKENYLDYEKPIKDAQGFNKGECEREYAENEEYFYNDYYDHWNVDKVYDEEIAKENKNEEVITETETESEKKVCPYCGQPIE